MLSKWKKPVPFRCHIDMSAFIGVMLAFLFILMPMTIYDFPRGVVDLARADHSLPMTQAVRDDAIMLAVQRDGKLYLNGSQLSPQSLTAAIQEEVRSGSEKKVYLRADARARYKAVIAAIDAIHEAGIEHIGILTEQRHASR